MSPCVYHPERPANGREHWLPQALGTFGELQVLHDRICEECNQEFGRTTDLEFIRTGPEGLFRSALDLPRGAAAERGNPFMFRAAGAHPVQGHQIVPPEDEAGLFWEAYSEQGEPRGRLLEQIVVSKPDGTRVVVPFNVNWSADVLREALRVRNADGGTLAELYLDPDKVQQARPALSAVFPGFQAEHFGRDGAGQQDRRMVFQNRITDVYLRGVGKIAFHGALKFLPHLDGAHDNFAALRIWLKGEGQRPPGTVRLEGNPIVQGLGHGVMVAQWGHIIAVESTYEQVLVRLQFYIGPGWTPRTWVIRLGTNPSRIVHTQAVAYFCQYFAEPAADGGHDGQFVEVADVRIVRL